MFHSTSSAMSAFSSRSSCVTNEGVEMDGLPSRLSAAGWAAPWYREGGALPGSQGTSGLGGCTVAQLLAASAEARKDCAGIVMEALDPRVGNWQYSQDDGVSWRTVRTDILHSGQQRGLVLTLTARLRVLPYGGSAHQKVRMVWHTVQQIQARHSGCYCPYVAQECDGAGPSLEVALELAHINGTPASPRLPRQRNKRALAALRRVQTHAGAGQAGV